ncbi:MAG TPA: lysozyme inhibitor LprI family protein, partial [Stellaceae bacterium]|nr:lysozyme inhibitor LprI family protein [Stellaceae bacterium]
MSLALVDAADAATASFDCAIASAPIEKIICGNDDLAALDLQLGQAYTARRRGLRHEELAALRREQLDWLRSRLSSCNVPATPDVEPPDDVVQCLSDFYRHRIDELQAATPALNGAPAAPTPVTEAPTDGVERDEKVFSVDRAGRYAIRLQSKTGALLQVIDRMAGPSPLAGEIGKQDGRLDLFLDRGSYKAVMLTREGSADHPGLRVDPFQELNGADLPRLVELKPVASDLDDLTQRSWWIEIAERRDVAIEAAGRHLTDLRLWKDGNWLVDAMPAESVVESEPGQPLAVRQLATKLEPGLYLLTAYGGPGVPWSKGSDAKPLYLRLGIPVLAEAEQRRMVASPTGVDRYLVPKPANLFRLQLDAPDTAALTVSPYNPSTPFAKGGSRGEIAKNGRVPAAEISTWVSSDFALVTVERQAGQPYLLQNFHSARFFAITGGADYWIEAIHAATSDDDPDLTGVLTENSDGHTRIVASSAIEVGPNKPWQRRFNLLDRVTLYTSIAAAGSYRVTAEGENVDAEFRFEPVGPKPSNYRTPAFERGDHVWTLERGIYLLTLAPRPEKKGIATVTVMPADYAGAVKPAPRLAVVAMRSQHLAEDADYALSVGELPGISSGLVLRRRPLDLATDLPMTLKPRERVEIAATLPAGDDGMLAASAVDGKAIPVAVDGAPPAPGTHLRAGPHRIVIANAEDHALPLTLHVDRDALQPEAPLPVMSAEPLQALPAFPVLTPDQPAFFDLAKSQQRSFNIAVTAPALYRLETGGLLATEGNLRTRMVTSLARAEANGIGRNFLIQNYLREGDYQISLAPTGASAGHLSLALTAAPIADGGALSFGIPSRATLSPGHGVRYDFRIDHKATYHLTAFGLARTFPIRVEDEDGWPVGDPIVDGEMSRVFLPGLYHVTLLPTAVESLSLTLIEEVKPPVAYAGHGPFDLPFDNPVANEWLEPGPGGERAPDLWRFSLPAAADVTLTIGDGMIGTLRQGDAVVADKLRGPSWRGSLPAGDYRLELRSTRPNNHLPYTLALHSEEMLVGQSRAVKAPAEVEIALGGNDLVEVSSFGNADVRARLYDAENHLVAANDDRADDWNFDIAASLAPGRYRLKVDPVGTEKAATRVDLVRPEEKNEPPLVVPGTAAIADAALHTYPLTVNGAGLLVISAQSREATSLSLERMAADKTWRSVAISRGATPFLAIPVTPGTAGNYRVRVWSTDRKPAEIGVVTSLATPAPASEADLARGITPTAVAGIEPPLFVAAATPVEPGVWHLAGADAHLLWSSAAGTAA